MRRVAGRTLWIGHAGDLADPRPLLAEGIAAVVELADNEPAAILPRDLIRCRFPLSDGGQNPAWLLRLAAESVAAFVRAEVPVLVACSNGMSRSVSIAAAGVALAEGWPPGRALHVVAAAGPVDLSPRLLMQIQDALGQDRMGSRNFSPT